MHEAHTAAKALIAGDDDLTAHPLLLSRIHELFELNADAMN